MKSGGMLAVGTNMVAYAQQDGDLDVQSFDKSYGVLVPALGSAQTGGLLLDLRFSGDAIRGGNLFEVLRSDSGAGVPAASGPRGWMGRTHCDRVPPVIPCAGVPIQALAVERGPTPDSKNEVARWTATAAAPPSNDQFHSPTIAICSC